MKFVRRVINNWFNFVLHRRVYSAVYSVLSECLWTKLHSRLGRDWSGREVKTSALVSRRSWVRIPPESPVICFSQTLGKYTVLYTRRWRAKLNKLNSIFELRLYSTCSQNVCSVMDPHVTRVELSRRLSFFPLTLNFVIKTNFASTCITGDMIECLLEFEPYWLLE